MLASLAPVGSLTNTLLQDAKVFTPTSSTGRCQTVAMATERPQSELNKLQVLWEWDKPRL